MLSSWGRSLAKSYLSKNLRRAIKDVRTEISIQRTHRANLRRAQRLSHAAPLRLNLASGFHPKPGWLNVDLMAPEADLRLDLREPLPFPDASVEMIYAEHFFEHLNYPDLGDSTAWQLETPEQPSEALLFLRECRRVLVPGGTLDLVVPDVEMTLDEYHTRREQPFPRHEEWWGPKWCDTPLHCVNYVFRQGREHKYAYDCETLARVLACSGFTDVRRRPFDPSLEAPNHQLGSLCMRARKPDAAH
jgi:predicted SAM-dependent methyltransferase